MCILLGMSINLMNIIITHTHYKERKLVIYLKVCRYYVQLGCRYYENVYCLGKCH